jgi:hypothetical protein
MPAHSAFILIDFSRNHGRTVQKSSHGLPG